MKKIELLSNWMMISLGLALFWGGLTYMLFRSDGVTTGVMIFVFLIVFVAGMLCVAASRADELERMLK